MYINNWSVKTKKYILTFEFCNNQKKYEEKNDHVQH